MAEKEGITHGIRPESKRVVVRDSEGKEIEEKKLKYKIKTRYGLIPVYEKKEQVKCNHSLLLTVMCVYFTKVKTKFVFF